jgi:uncharacterized phage protein (TIGR01671 family)
MIEIKFRAWNGYTMNYNIIVGKYGAFWVSPGVKNNGLDENDSASLTPFNTKCHENTAIMQFTGLQDKNGKDIYEGDILKIESEKVMVVTWNKKFASFNLDRDGWMFQHWFGESCNPEQTEVVGNIYENKELLNG